jgi:putative endopeptidase
MIILMASVMTMFSDCGKKPAKKGVAAIDTANMDKSVQPGVDFYQYVNGSWIKKHPVPDEYSRYAAFDVLQEQNYDDLKSIMEESSKDDKADKASNRKKIGDFYASGMDSAKIDKDGVKPLADEFSLIDAVKTKEDLQKEIAHLHTVGVYPLFYVYAAQDDKNSEMVITQLRQGGLGLPDRDYYLSKDDRSKEIRDGYKEHLVKMFSLLGDDDKKAKANADEVLKLETKLAEASWTRLELRDPVQNYNKLTLDELQKKSPEMKWKDYFSGIGLEKPGDINVGQPSFFVKLSGLLKDVSIDTWKTYLRWNLINSTASYLSSDFEKQNFEFYSKTLSGKEKMQPRWKRVLKTVNGGLSEAVGQVYVDKFFPPESKTAMIELVNNLKASLKERIQNLTWMGKETKAAALAKLEAMNVKIGYPDKWRDYSKLAIVRDSYVKNVMNSDKYEFEYMLSKIGKPVDRQEWHMSPQTVNAYYSPNMNEIVFPAAILQPPFFDKDADPAVNYGGIGAVIGHEMTHGFDDEGRQYDKKGNLADWWTADDAKKFTEQTAILIDQYDNYKILDSLHVNGKLTLGENIADYGGLTISLNALKSVWKKSGDTSKIDGFTPLQRFFLSYAQIWRMSIRDKELMRRLKEDVHSPAMARVNAAVRNIPEFYEAFQIKTTDPLFLAAEKRAKIW